MPDPGEYARRRNALVSHLARLHGLVGYDPFPLGTEHAYPTDTRGNVLVPNHDLGRLLSLHEQEGIHGPSTHQHESAAEQERRGRYVPPDEWRLWRLAAGHAHKPGSHLLADPRYLREHLLRDHRVTAAADATGADLARDHQALPHIAWEPAQGTGHPITQALGHVQRLGLSQAEAAALASMRPQAARQAAAGRQIADAMRQDLPDLDDVTLGRIALRFAAYLTVAENSQPGVRAADMAIVLTAAAAELTALETGIGLPPAPPDIEPGP